MTFTLKVLEKHSPAVTALLESCDCDYAYTGAVIESCGTKTHGWFVSRPQSSDAIGIEETLAELLIPYETTQHGPEFRIFKNVVFRLDEDRNPQQLRQDHGDNTLDLMNELEHAIAGNDYSFVRNFISRKRREQLNHLSWDTQQTYTEEYEAA